MNNKQKEEVYQYLRFQYEGVFTEKQLNRHIDDYIGYSIADQQLDQVLQKIKPGSRLLDIGCGFGTFVLRAREWGLDAIGIDIANFEIEFARKRLSEKRPADDPDYVYRFSNGIVLPFQDESFDVVTLWNVIEHIADYKKLLTESLRILRRDGYLYIVCPNYASFRREAHYGVTWFPFFPRKLAQAYLRFIGRNPDFFKKNIFYSTNWGILFALKRFGMEIYDIQREKLEDAALIKQEALKRTIMFLKQLRLLWFVKLVLKLSFYNPFKSSVVLYARKKGRV